MKLAVLRFSALGDLAASLPVLRALNTKPVIITTPLGRELLKDEFSEFILLQDKKPITMMKMAMKIRQAGFSDIIDLQSNDRSKILTFLSGAAVHGSTGIEMRQSATNIFADIAKKSGCLDSLDRSYTVRSSDYIVLNCGSSAKWLSKRLPDEKWIEISRVLNQRFGTRIVLSGDRSERDYLEELAPKLAGAVEVVAGETSIPELKTLLQNALLTVSTDSAAMHMSAVQKTPTIGVFGPTNWIRSAPWGDWSTVVYDEGFYPDGEPPQQSNPRVDRYFDGISIVNALDRLAPYLPSKL